MIGISINFRQTKFIIYLKLCRTISLNVRDISRVRFISKTGLLNQQLTKKRRSKKMANKKRLSPNQYAREKNYFENLRGITGYRSQKPEYEVAAIEAVVNIIEDATARESRLRAELAEVRDIIAENGAILVEKNDGSVIQVAAQFGEDSPQYQSLGRKRKSERRSGRRGGSGQSGNTP